MYTVQLSLVSAKLLLKSAVIGRFHGSLAGCYGVSVRITSVLYKRCTLRDHTVQHCNRNLLLCSSCGLSLHRHNTIHTPPSL